MHAHLFIFFVASVSASIWSVYKLYIDRMVTMNVDRKLEKIKMKPIVGERFSEFFEKWVLQLDEFKGQLLSVSKDKNEQEVLFLLSKVTSHLKEYYTVKWAEAHEDVLAFYCPIWISPLEKSYCWITGWKPSIAFKLFNSLRQTRVILSELTEDQLLKIQELMVNIKVEEEKVEREMERQQVSIADKQMVELSQLGRIGESVVKVEGAVKGLMVGLERVMKAADCVRLKTLKGILDLLTPFQRVDFLAGIIMLQVQLRVM